MTNNTRQRHHRKLYNLSPWPEPLLTLFSKMPVCVLGLGLIGGSIMRAAKAAGREVFGYNRSVEGAHAAVGDGFDASTDLTDTLHRAAEAGALIALAVPMPALGGMLAHVSESGAKCPLHRRHPCSNARCSTWSPRPVCRSASSAVTR